MSDFIPELEAAEEVVKPVPTFDAPEEELSFEEFSSPQAELSFEEFSKPADSELSFEEFVTKPTPPKKSYYEELQKYATKHKFLRGMSAGAGEEGLSFNPDGSLDYPFVHQDSEWGVKNVANSFSMFIGQKLNLRGDSIMNSAGDEQEFSKMIYDFKKDYNLTEDEVESAYSDFQKFHKPMEMEESLRTLSDGRILPNPLNPKWMDKDLAEAEILASNASPEYKKAFIDNLDKLQQDFAIRQIEAYTMGNIDVPSPLDIGIAFENRDLGEAWEMPISWAERNGREFDPADPKFVRDYKKDVIDKRSLLSGYKSDLAMGMLKLSNIYYGAGGLVGIDAMADVARNNALTSSAMGAGKVDTGMIGSVIQEAPSLTLQIAATMLSGGATSVGFKATTAAATQAAGASASSAALRAAAGSVLKEAAVAAPTITARAKLTGTLAAVSMAGVQSAAVTYAQLRSQGMDHEEAQDKSVKAGASTAIITGIFQASGLGGLEAATAKAATATATMKDIYLLGSKEALAKGTISFAGSALKNYLGEFAEEGLDELASTFLTSDPDTPIPDAWNNAVHAALVGGFIGVSVGTSTEALAGGLEFYGMHQTAKALRVDATIQQESSKTLAEAEAAGIDPSTLVPTEVGQDAAVLKSSINKKDGVEVARTGDRKSFLETIFGSPSAGKQYNDSFDNPSAIKLVPVKGHPKLERVVHQDEGITRNFDRVFNHETGQFEPMSDEVRATFAKDGIVTTDKGLYEVNQKAEEPMPPVASTQESLPPDTSSEAQREGQSETSASPSASSPAPKAEMPTDPLPDGQKPTSGDGGTSLDTNLKSLENPNGKPSTPKTEDETEQQGPEASEAKGENGQKANEQKADIQEVLEEDEDLYGAPNPFGTTAPASAKSTTAPNYTSGGVRVHNQTSLNQILGFNETKAPGQGVDPDTGEVKGDAPIRQYFIDSHETETEGGGANKNVTLGAMKVGTLIVGKGEKGKAASAYRVVKTAPLRSGAVRHYVQPLFTEDMDALNAKGKANVWEAGFSYAANTHELMEATEAIRALIKGKKDPRGPEVRSAVEKMIRDAFSFMVGESFTNDNVSFTDISDPMQVTLSNGKPVIQVNLDHYVNRVIDAADYADKSVPGFQQLSYDIAESIRIAGLEELAHHQIYVDWGVNTTNGRQLSTSVNAMLDQALSNKHVMFELAKSARHTLRGDLVNMTDEQVVERLQVMRDANPEKFGQTAWQLGHEMLASLYSRVKVGKDAASMNESIVRWRDVMAAGDLTPGKVLMKRLEELARRYFQAIKDFFTAHESLSHLPMEMQQMLRSLEDLMDSNFKSIPSLKAETEAFRFEQQLAQTEADLATLEKKSAQNSLDGFDDQRKDLKRRIRQLTKSLERAKAEVVNQTSTGLRLPDVIGVRAEAVKQQMDILDHPAVFAKDGYEFAKTQKQLRETLMAMREQRNDENWEPLTIFEGNLVLTDKVKKEEWDQIQPFLDQLNINKRAALTKRVMEASNDLNRVLTWLNRSPLTKKVVNENGLTEVVGAFSKILDQPVTAVIKAFGRNETQSTIVESLNAALPKVIRARLGITEDMLENPPSSLSEFQSGIGSVDPTGKKLIRMADEEGVKADLAKDALDLHDATQDDSLPESRIQRKRLVKEMIEADERYQQLLINRNRYIRKATTRKFKSAAQVKLEAEAAALEREMFATPEESPKFQSILAKLKEANAKIDAMTEAAPIDEQALTLAQVFAKEDALKTYQLAALDPMFQPLRSIPELISRRTSNPEFMDHAIRLAYPQGTAEFAINEIESTSRLGGAVGRLLQFKEELNYMLMGGAKPKHMRGSNEFSDVGQNVARGEMMSFAGIQQLYTGLRPDEVLDVSGYDFSGQPAISVRGREDFVFTDFASNTNQRQNHVEAMSKQLITGWESASSLFGIEALAGKVLDRNGNRLTGAEKGDVMTSNARYINTFLIQDMYKAQQTGDDNARTEILKTMGFSLPIKETEASGEAGVPHRYPSYPDRSVGLIPMPDVEIEETVGERDYDKEAFDLLSAPHFIETVRAAVQYMNEATTPSKDRTPSVFFHKSGLTPAGLAFQAVAPKLLEFLAVTKGLSLNLGGKAFNPEVVLTQGDQVIADAYKNLMQGLEKTAPIAKIKEEAKRMFKGSENSYAVTSRFWELHRSLKVANAIFDQSRQSGPNSKLMKWHFREQNARMPFSMETLNSSAFTVQGLSYQTRTSPNDEKTLLSLMRTKRAQRFIEIGNSLFPEADELVIRNAEAEEGGTISTAGDFDRRNDDATRETEVYARSANSDRRNNIVDAGADEKQMRRDRLERWRAESLLMLLGGDPDAVIQYVYSDQFMTLVEDVDGEMVPEFDEDAIDNAIMDRLQELQQEEIDRGVVIDVNGMSFKDAVVGLQSRVREQARQGLFKDDGKLIKKLQAAFEQSKKDTKLASRERAAKFRELLEKQGLRFDGDLDVPLSKPDFDLADFNEEDFYFPADRDRLAALDLALKHVSLVQKSNGVDNIDFEAQAFDADAYTLFTSIASSIPGLAFIEGSANWNLMDGGPPALVFIPDQDTPTVVMPYGGRQMASNAEVQAALADMFLWSARHGGADLVGNAKRVLEVLASQADANPSLHNEAKNYVHRGMRRISEDPSREFEGALRDKKRESRKINKRAKDSGGLGFKAQQKDVASSDPELAYESFVASLASLVIKERKAMKARMMDGKVDERIGQNLIGPILLETLHNGVPDNLTDSEAAAVIVASLTDRTVQEAMLMSIRSKPAGNGPSETKQALRGNLVSPSLLPSLTDRLREMVFGKFSEAIEVRDEDGNALDPNSGEYAEAMNLSVAELAAEELQTGRDTATTTNGTVLAMGTEEQAEWLSAFLHSVMDQVEPKFADQADIALVEESNMLLGTNSKVGQAAPKGLVETLPARGLSEMEALQILSVLTRDHLDQIVDAYTNGKGISHAGDLMKLNQERANAVRKAYNRMVNVESGNRGSENAAFNFGTFSYDISLWSDNSRKDVYENFRIMKGAISNAVLDGAAPVMDGFGNEYVTLEADLDAILADRLEKGRAIFVASQNFNIGKDQYSDPNAFTKSFRAGQRLSGEDLEIVRRERPELAIQDLDFDRREFNARRQAMEDELVALRQRADDLKARRNAAILGVGEITALKDDLEAVRSQQAFNNLLNQNGFLEIGGSMFGAPEIVKAAFDTPRQLADSVATNILDSFLTSVSELPDYLKWTPGLLAEDPNPGSDPFVRGYRLTPDEIAQPGLADSILAGMANASEANPEPPVEARNFLERQGKSRRMLSTRQQYLYMLADDVAIKMPGFRLGLEESLKNLGNAAGSVPTHSTSFDQQIDDSMRRLHEAFRFNQKTHNERVEKLVKQVNKEIPKLLDSSAFLINDTDGAMASLARFESLLNSLRDTEKLHGMMKMRLAQIAVRDASLDGESFRERGNQSFSYKTNEDPEFAYMRKIFPESGTRLALPNRAADRESAITALRANKKDVTSFEELYSQGRGVSQAFDRIKISPEANLKIRAILISEKEQSQKRKEIAVIVQQDVFPYETAAVIARTRLLSVLENAMADTTYSGADLFLRVMREAQDAHVFKDIPDHIGRAITYDVAKSMIEGRIRDAETDVADLLRKKALIESKYAYRRNVITAPRANHASKLVYTGGAMSIDILRKNHMDRGLTWSENYMGEKNTFTSPTGQVYDQTDNDGFEDALDRMSRADKLAASAEVLTKIENRKFEVVGNLLAPQGVLNPDGTLQSPLATSGFSLANSVQAAVHPSDPPHVVQAKNKFQSLMNGYFFSNVQKTQAKGKNPIPGKLTDDRDPSRRLTDTLLRVLINVYNAQNTPGFDNLGNHPYVDVNGAPQIEESLAIRIPKVLAKIGPNTSAADFKDLIDIHSEIVNEVLAVNNTYNVGQSILKADDMNERFFAQGLRNHDPLVRKMFALNAKGRAAALDALGVIDHGATGHTGRQGYESTKDAWAKLFTEQYKKLKGPRAFEDAAAGVMFHRVIDYLAATNQNIEERAKSLLEMFKQADLGFSDALTKDQITQVGGNPISEVLNMTRSKLNDFQRDATQDTLEMLGQRKVYEELRNFWKPMLETGILQNRMSIDDFKEMVLKRGHLTDQAKEWGQFVRHSMEHIRESLRISAMMNGLDPDEFMRNKAVTPMRWRVFGREHAETDAFPDYGDVLAVDRASYRQAPTRTPKSGEIHMLDISGFTGPWHVIDDALHRIMMADAYSTFKGFAGVSQTSHKGKRQLTTPGALHHHGQRLAGAEDRTLVLEASARLSFLGQEIIHKDVFTVTNKSLVMDGIQQVARHGAVKSLLSAKQWYAQTLPGLVAYSYVREGIGGNKDFPALFTKIVNSMLMGRAQELAHLGTDLRALGDNVDNFTMVHGPLVYRRKADGEENWHKSVHRSKPSLENRTTRSFGDVGKGRAKKALFATTYGAGATVGAVRDASDWLLHKAIATPEAAFARSMFAHQIWKMVKATLPKADQPTFEDFVDPIKGKAYNITTKMKSDAERMVNDMIASTDTAKKAEILQQANGAGKEFLRGFFATFANHPLHTWGNSDAAISMMRHGDAESRRDGRRLFASNVFQNVMFQLTRIEVAMQMFGFIVPFLASGFLDDREEERWSKWIRGAFYGINPDGSRKDGMAGMMKYVAMSLGSSNPMGFKEGEGWSEQDMNSDATTMAARVLKEGLVQVIPGAATTLGGKGLDLVIDKTVRAIFDPGHWKGSQAGFVMGDGPRDGKLAASVYRPTWLYQNWLSDLSYFTIGMSSLVDPAISLSTAKDEVTPIKLGKLLGAELPILSRDWRAPLQRHAQKEMDSKMWSDYWERKTNKRTGLDARF